MSLSSWGPSQGCSEQATERASDTSNTAVSDSSSGAAGERADPRMQRVEGRLQSIEDEILGVKQLLEKLLLQER